MRAGSVRFDCHFEQAFFARRGIWASRAMSRSLRHINRALGSPPYQLRHHLCCYSISKLR